VYRAPDGLPDTKEIAVWQDGEGEEHEQAAANLLALFNDDNPAADKKSLLRYYQKVHNGLDQCDLEIANLTQPLVGGYIPPGLAGSLATGQVDALPTGRKFFYFEQGKPGLARTGKSLRSGRGDPPPAGGCGSQTMAGGHPHAECGAGSGPVCRRRYGGSSWTRLQ
jgi:hypothetical protein